MSGPRTVLRPRRFTLRARLTLVYGAMFLAAGAVLLGLTYILFNARLGAGGTFNSSATEPSAAPAGTPARAPGPGPEPGPEHQRFTESREDVLRDAAGTSLLTQGGIALLVVGAAAAGAGWLVAGRVLAPLHRVTDTARRIADAPAAGRGLHERIALAGPDDEVKELADTFDTMVERLDRSFDGQRRFVANASHELRTPLTLGRALVETAMHRPAASADIRRLGEDLLQINSRHERLISGLLLLASSENEITERHPVDLADIVTHVAAQAVSEAAKAGIEVTVKTAEAWTAGDALLLERLVHNLVENAVRHNSGAGGHVRVTCATGAGGRAELRVANTGPTVPPYEIPALFEPFRRLGADRLVTGGGAGLGLSIVRAVARAHGGDASARPRDGGGLTVTVTLPPDPDAGRYSGQDAGQRVEPAS
ncbi:two-component sensor histidine kinase [Streptomyces sp. WAC 06738]|uniref:sensor histidine kinase n=1 Tax=Streptomyces sp. WAC 06738 TaxID=2203210 RepID=UPI000F6E8510|nr:HAMP domain-containing sensor histidine kinase [Streptomyces sp. WAC 06738]AZM49032.1 two-component sensor histidine kinase [Streptomyces sp. WAC 06738]